MENIISLRNIYNSVFIQQYVFSVLSHKQFQMAFSNFMNVEVLAVWSTYNVTLVRLQNTVAKGRHGGGREGTPEEMAKADLSAQGSGPGRVSHGELAYVLHTSGTTGLPKTVRVPHKCIVPNILHLRLV